MSKASFDLNELRYTCANCSLSQLCLPAAIDLEDVARLEEFVHRNKPYDRGQRVFDMGTPMQGLYVIRSGSLKTFMQNEDGEDQIIGFHLPGEIVGFDGFEQDIHSCYAQALERTSVCELRLDELETVAAQVPGLNRQMMRIISREVQRDHDHLVLLSRKSAHERLAIFLRSLSERFRKRGFSAEEFSLTMSRYDIANYLGLAVETVSRLFTRFHDEGVIRAERRQVTLLDHQKLAELAGESSETACH